MTPDLGKRLKVPDMLLPDMRNQPSWNDPVSRKSREETKPVLKKVHSENGMEGRKKEGRGKPHEGHSSRKGVLDPPCSGTFSTLLTLFFLLKSPQLSRPEQRLGYFFSGDFCFRFSPGRHKIGAVESTGL